MTKKQTKTKKASWKERFTQPFLNMKKRGKGFLSRRPHRSFKLTRRRDYKRSFKIAGYWAFSLEVLRLLRRNKKLFLYFITFYAVISAILVGLASQETYLQLSEVLQGQELFSMPLAETGLLFIAATTGALNGGSSESHQIVNAFLLLFGWLLVVWLVRQRMAGHAVKLRDGIYSCGAPIIATLIVAIVAVIQLLPLALGIIAYAVLQTSGLITFGVEMMLAGMVVALLGALSLYWVIPSFIGLVIVTLPGMYPFKALKTAGDLVVGRRLKVALRLLWLGLSILLLWLLVLIPIILLDQAIQIDWLPLVPLAILLLSVMSMLWASTYIYMLYRRLINDETPPA